MGNFLFIDAQTQSSTKKVDEPTAIKRTEPSKQEKVQTKNDRFVLTDKSNEITEQKIPPEKLSELYKDVALMLSDGLVQLKNTPNTANRTGFMDTYYLNRSVDVLKKMKNNKMSFDELSRDEKLALNAVGVLGKPTNGKTVFSDNEKLTAAILLLDEFSKGVGKYGSIFDRVRYGASDQGDLRVSASDLLSFAQKASPRTANELIPIANGNSITRSEYMKNALGMLVLKTKDAAIVQEVTSLPPKPPVQAAPVASSVPTPPTQTSVITLTPKPPVQAAPVASSVPKPPIQTSVITLAPKPPVQPATVTLLPPKPPVQAALVTSSVPKPPTQTSVTPLAPKPPSSLPLTSDNVLSLSASGEDKYPNSLSAFTNQKQNNTSAVSYPYFPPFDLKLGSTRDIQKFVESLKGNYKNYHYGSEYFAEIARQVSASEKRISIEEACVKASQKIVRDSARHVPTYRLSTEINPQDTTKEVEVLFIVGSSHNSTQKACFRLDAEITVDAIQRAYGSKCKHTEILEDPNEKTFMDSLAKRAKSAEDNGRKLILCYSGHGSTRGLQSGVSQKDKYKEGSQEFNYGVRFYFTETHMKKLKCLKNIETILIIDACYSGAAVTAIDREQYKKSFGSLG